MPRKGRGGGGGGGRGEGGEERKCYFLREVSGIMIGGTSFHLIDYN